MTATPPRSRLSLYLDLIRFNRPAGWLVCLWPTLSALWAPAAASTTLPTAALTAM